MASYGSRRPEVWSRLLKHSGKGGKTYREAAEAYRKRAEELRAMADAIDNRIKTLDVGTSGDMWNSAMAAYQRFIQQLRQAAESTDETAERAEKQGEITDKARSSMPSVGTIMGVWSAYLAAKASHNYGLAAAMLAKYMGLWDTAASIMSGYDNSSSSNVDSVSAPSESPSIANQAAAAPLANNLLESWTPPHSDAGPEPNQHVPPSESPTLDRLNGGGGGGGGGVPVGMVAGLAPGTAVRVPATWNTGRAVGAPGMAYGAPAGRSGAPMGAVPPAAAHGRDKRRQRTSTVAPDRGYEVPELELPATIGVIDRGDDSDGAADAAPQRIQDHGP